MTVPVKSLCPCSKAVSDYGAHNQRSLVSVDVKADGHVWLEDVIEAVEASASAPLYALLKRDDEKFVTEQAYDNPKFVEDLVRDVVIAVRAIPGVTWLKVRASNQESIHNHSATAEIEWTRDASVETAPAATPSETPAPDALFGSWLRDQRTARQQSQKALLRCWRPVGLTPQPRGVRRQDPLARHGRAPGGRLGTRCDHPRPAGRPHPGCTARRDCSRPGRIPRLGRVTLPGGQPLEQGHKRPKRPRGHRRVLARIIVPPHPHRRSKARQSLKRPLLCIIHGPSLHGEAAYR